MKNSERNFVGIEEKLPVLQLLPLSFQHLFAMFGATVLVPALTHMNPAIALLTAGIGTLIFHFVTKRKVPVFLGSSFAFIAALLIVIDGKASNIPKAQGAIMIAGLVYLMLSVLVYFAAAPASGWTRKFFLYTTYTYN